MSRPQEWVWGVIVVVSRVNVRRTARGTVWEGTVCRPVSVFIIRVGQFEQLCLYSGVKNGRRDVEGVINSMWKQRRRFTDVRGGVGSKGVVQRKRKREWKIQDGNQQMQVEGLQRRRT